MPALSNTIPNPIETKPSLDINVKCNGDVDACFVKLKSHFGAHCRDTAASLTRVYGSADAGVVDTMKLVAEGGVLRDSSLFFFYKPIGNNFNVHQQGFETVESLLSDRKWLEKQFNESKVSCEITSEELNARVSFKPKQWFSFFNKEIVAYLLPIVGLLIFSLYQYLVAWLAGAQLTPEIWNSLLASVIASVIAIVLWLTGTSILYLKKRKKYVFELPED